MQRSALVPNLYVPDVPAAVRFYGEVLDFTCSGRWTEDDRLIWAEVTREGPQGTARIWFFSEQIDDRPGPVLSGVLYLFVQDVDAEAERLEDKVKVCWGPEDQPYGLRELGIEDPNGYLICLAQDL